MRSLWGVGPAGPIHFGYDTAALEQLELVAQGHAHTILFADLHVMMSHGLPYPEVRRRAAYYEAVFSAGYGIKARFLRGSDFETASDYVTLLLGASTQTTLTRLIGTLSAGTSRDDRQSRTLAAVLYSLMQCLDTVYLGTEIVLADDGQRKIYDLISSDQRFAQSIAALIEHRAHYTATSMPEEYRYYPLMVDTAGKRLNESTSKTRISIHESPDSLLTKVKSMYAPPPGQPLADGRINALLAYLQYSAFPWLPMPVTIQTRDGAIVCDAYAEAEQAYNEGRLHPGDLKHFLFESLLTRVRQFRDRLATVSYGWINQAIVSSDTASDIQ